MQLNRDTLLIFAAALGAGVLIGLVLAPRGGRHDDHSRDESVDKRRTGSNIVFGNIIVGSNNAPDANMSFCYDDSGDNDR